MQRPLLKSSPLGQANAPSSIGGFNFEVQHPNWRGGDAGDAEAEATRDGVVPIELIDGERLVELFQDKLIGVKPKTVYEIDHAFFDEFRREG